MDDEGTPPLSAAGSSKASSASPIPEVPVQPAYFYPSGHNATHRFPDDGGFLNPDQDPLATRGIPVFTPTLEEFSDFEKYMTRVEVWGRKSGIVKVIPPQEWTDALPPINSRLSELKLKHPIEQHMMGQGGLFRQNNVEKRRTLSLKEWAQLCSKDELKAYPIKDGEVKTRGLHRTARKPRNTRKSKAVAKEDADDDPTAVEAVFVETPELKTSHGHTAAASDYPTPQSNLRDGETFVEDGPSTSEPIADPFYSTFDPRTSWLPPETNASDYTPEACRELERVFWRTCGLGTPAQYGADMAGSLFTEATKHWNVSDLPSFLNRLCKNKALPGVNTPYLYFGMWRATFAWHVEDMDLYSINYIHWGAPKYWYAIPSERSKAFEGVMKGFFPGDSTECPQYLRHKSYLVSPTLLSQSFCRPNTLVQHQGEFVITYPRGYHAGFNLGLNCAESVNFALESWVELGRKAGVCNCVGDSVRIDVDALLNSAEELREDEQKESEENQKKRKHNVPDSEERKPKRVKKEANAMDASADGQDHAKSDSRPRIRLPWPPVPVTPCCLCAGVDTEGLLRVHDPPQQSSSARPTVVVDDSGEETMVWSAHEQCARVIPETWVDEIKGEKFVFGVDGIGKDRWTLKCAECTRNTLKIHGAKVQCTKGKCPKAYHVTCAMRATDVAYAELGEIEKSVVLLDNDALDPPSDPSQDEDNRRIIKTIKKPIVEIMCIQHNPVVLERKKQAKREQTRKDVLALAPEARIKIRNASGVCEVTVASVNEGRETVTVIWTDGMRRDFSWRSIIWGQVAEGTIIKRPEAEVAPVKTSRQPTQTPSGSSAPAASSSAGPSHQPVPVAPQQPHHTYYSGAQPYGAPVMGQAPATYPGVHASGYYYPQPIAPAAYQPAAAARTSQPGPSHAVATYPPGYQQPLSYHVPAPYHHQVASAPPGAPPYQPAYYSPWAYQPYYAQQPQAPRPAGQQVAYQYAYPTYPPGTIAYYGTPTHPPPTPVQRPQAATPRSGAAHPGIPK